MHWLTILALTSLAISSAGTIATIILEHLHHRELWELLMKIFPWFFGLGAVLLAYSIAKAWLILGG